jgi:hypothetical protein
MPAGQGRDRRPTEGSMGKGSTLKEIWSFLRVRKKWWLVPVVVLLGLIGALLFLTQGSALAPFIYALF